MRTPLVQRLRNLRLPVKLMLVFLPLIILPALTGIYLLTQTATSTGKEMASDYASDLMGLMMQKIDDRLLGYEQLSKQIITDRELHALLRREPESSFEAFQIESDINTKMNKLWLGDDQHKYVTSIVFDTPWGIYSYGKSAVEDYGIADPAYQADIAAARGGAVWFVPDTFVSGQREVEVFRVGRLIRDERFRELGNLTIAIDSDAFRSIFEQTALRDNVKLHLLTEDGEPMLGSQPAALSGKETLLSLTRGSMHNGWRLSAELPLDELYGPLRRMTQLAFVVVFACVLLGLGVTQLLNIDVIIPIHRLMANMKRGIKGTRPHELRPIRGAIEIVEMNDTFISVMYEIEQLIQQVVKEEARKKEAEIRVLQNQLSPHFLYNTLNSIRWMAMIQKQQNIKDMIDALIQLLTYAVRGPSGPVPLREEVAILHSYVNIQKVRFQHFGFAIDIAPELEDARIPKLLLQPLIENALLHGLSSLDRPGEIRIEGEAAGTPAGSEIRIRVSDNGVGIEAGMTAKLNRMLKGHEPPKDHFGLYSVQERIQLHYGRQYGMTIEPGEQGGTVVTVRMPCRRGPREGED
ncbi:sensor histidine kinase [Paenibacillus sp. IB182496]|uniref:Sensor histidine kinase n=1 Tax=Paenibacillus sabuli TaxID=2772509 RepID=A0A927BZY7_9BACL|nr:sensor histidine kinase [Paenibacillus sabuli]MBD2848378.1 sensor histidine kinase [Paenibacillus sabuli]